MPTILAVDDSASMRQMVTFTLKGAGFSVIDAVDGVDALSKVKGKSVDLVLTDVNMPRMDGITLIKELRKLPDYRFTPILTLTTASGTDKKMAGKEAGATGWTAKPVRPAPVIATRTPGRAITPSPQGHDARWAAGAVPSPCSAPFCPAPAGGGRRFHPRSLRGLTLSLPPRPGVV